MAVTLDALIRLTARDAASSSIRSVESSIIRVVGAVASLRAAFATISFPVTQAVEFERALFEIQKTTEFSDESIGQLSNSIRAMSVDLGVAASDLALIGARAGQLGLGRQGREAIESFTETIARFSVVADLSVDEAANSIAKITNLFNIPIEQAEKVSSAFNELSNTTVATADQIVDVVRRVGSAGGLLEFADAAALAAQALELGQTPEVAGTALVKTFSNAQTAAKKFADTVGTTTEEWVRRLNADGLGAIKDAAAAIAELDTVAQGEAIQELFGGGRQFAFGQRLVEDAANGFQILNRTVASANAAFDDGRSSLKEFERLQRSVSRQVDLTTRQFENLGIAAGTVFLPAIRSALSALQAFASDPETIARVEALAENFLTVAKAIVETTVAVTNFLPSLEIMLELFTALAGIKVVTAGFAALAGLLVGALRFGASIANAARILNGFVVVLLSLPQALPLVGGAFLALSRTFAIAMSAIRAALFGPVGLGVLAAGGLLAYLFPGVRDFLSAFVTGFNHTLEETSQTTKEMLAQIEGDLANFREAVSKGNVDGGLIKIDASAIGTGAGDFTSQLQTAVNNLIQLDSVIRGAAAEIVRLADVNDRLFDRIVERRTESARLLQKLAEVNSLIEEGRAKGFIKPINRQEEEILKRRIASVRAEIALMEQAATAIASSIDSTKTVGSTLSDGLRAQAEEIASVFTANDIQVISLKRNLNAVTAALEGELKAQTELQDSLLRDKNPETFGARTSDLAEGAIRIGELEARITELNSKLGTDFDRLSKRIRGGVLDDLIDIGRTSDRSFKQLTDALARTQVGANSGAEAISEISQALVDNLAVAARAGSNTAGFKRLSDAANSTAASIKGVFDNLATETRTTQTRLAALAEELDNITKTRTLDFQIDVATDKATEPLRRELALTEQRFQRQIDAIDKSTASGRRYAAGLEKTRDELVRIRNVQIEETAARAEADRLDRKRLQAFARTKELQQELLKVTKEVEEADIGTAAGQSAQQKRIERARVLNELLRDSQVAAEKATITQAEFNDRVSTFLGQNRLEDTKPIVDPAYIEELKSQIEQLGEATLSAQNKAITSLNEQTGPLVKAVETLNTFQQRVDQANARLLVLVERAGLSAAQFKLITDETQRVVDNLELSVATAEELQNLLDSVPGNVTPILPSESSVNESIKAVRDGLVDIGVRELIEQQIKEGVGAMGAAFDQQFRELDPPPVHLNTLLPDIQQSIIQQAKNGTFELPVELDFGSQTSRRRRPGGSGPGAGFASGGLVEGPGTPTSDSIMAMLSAKEFVMDAKTVRHFGPSFFYRLQQLAKRGRALQFPGFASGGFVGAVRAPSVSVDGAGSTGVRDVVDVNLNVGGGSFRMSGDREMVSGLTRALRNLSRGE